MKIFTMTLISLMLALPTYAAISGGASQTQEYTYDFATHGGAVGFIDITGKMSLPAGAVVESLHYMVQTAPTSSSGALIAIGDAAGSNRYLGATAYDNAAFTANTPVKVSSGPPLYLSSANMGKVGVNITSGAVTAGKIKFWLQVYKPKQ